MGCWNESCMLSGLPILYREPVYVVMLVQNDAIGSGCYTTSMFVPVAVLEGTYNDYGSVEITGEKNEVKRDKVLEYLRKNAIINSEQKDFTLGTVMHKASQGCIMAKNPVTTKETAIRFVLIKKHLLDTVFEEAVEKDEYFKATAEKRQNVFQTVLTDWEEKKCTHQYSELYTLVMDNHYGNIFAMEFFKKMFFDGFDGMKEMYECILRMNQVLGDLRKAWHIPSGSGSQEHYETIHSVLVDVCRKDIDKGLAELDW